ncbi:2-amino-4-hydroxy-6-hydroxymethyldihydropteridine diphosphokinase [uncultured Ruminobacter sp.]|uniref:2-amino-4-hydroxy-6- hydroxymethyldihydropteridine diphosphokinase n=1 Tax=uncultured Ruminobacter sp. TaxID=538947 RepID=UPI0025D2B447|nr:2-amino-4-hydroxy-6-hydroxymethyldihydropteridine diphosphokinase [uncultured Ruminobacter sp.]
MTKVALALGSNLYRQVSLTHAMLKLRSVLTDMSCSEVYETVPLHAKGPKFYNAVVTGSTELSLEELMTFTKDTEKEMGRGDWYDRFGSRLSIRCLDIDVLLYGNVISEQPELPRSDIFKYSFVTVPLASLSPELTPPGCDRNVRSLAEAMSTDNLVPVSWLKLDAIG